MWFYHSAGLNGEKARGGVWVPVKYDLRAKKLINSNLKVRQIEREK